VQRASFARGTRTRSASRLGRSFTGPLNLCAARARAYCSPAVPCRPLLVHLLVTSVPVRAQLSAQLLPLAHEPVLIPSVSPQVNGKLEPAGWASVGVRQRVRHLMVKSLHLQHTCHYPRLLRAWCRASSPCAGAFC
jgi:hypothetical protein